MVFGNDKYYMTYFYRKVLRLTLSNYTSVGVGIIDFCESFDLRETEVDYCESFMREVQLK